MKFGSLFSGIGGFDLGFENAGMTPAWQCEIDQAASSVLKNHWPNVPNIGDVRDVRRNTVESIDVLCGGFPCQDVSIAGKRAGLAGERSGLWFEFARVIDELGPRTVIIENVPGLLSSNEGRDFAVILSGLVELGYGVCWRVLDAQYFGVPQRRRRVFLVGSLGDGRAAEILFERESMSGNLAPRREAGKDVAFSLRANASRSGDKGDGGINQTMIPIGIDGELNADENMIGALRSHQSGGSELYVMASAQANAEIVIDQSPTLTLLHEQPIVTTFQNTGQGYWQEREVGQSIRTPQGSGSLEANLIAYNIQSNDRGAHKRKDRPNGGLYVNETDTALTVGTTDLTAIAWQQNTRDEVRLISGDGQIAGALNSQAGMKQQNYVGVRRLTPVECERLQGFPDGWTAGQADTARYRQLGNAVAVPVAEWIGKRIVESS